MISLKNKVEKVCQPNSDFLHMCTNIKIYKDVCGLLIICVKIKNELRLNPKATLVLFSFAIHGTNYKKILKKTFLVTGWEVKSWDKRSVSTLGGEGVPQNSHFQIWTHFTSKLKPPTMMHYLIWAFYDNIKLFRGKLTLNINLCQVT